MSKAWIPQSVMSGYTTGKFDMSVQTLEITWGDLL